MPAKNPRINVVVDKSTYQHIRLLAKNEGVPLSTKTRDLLREALETHEDIELAALADERDATWDDAASLSHDETWS